MWQHKYIPTELGCNILVLITKYNTDNRGISLLESLWKVVKAIIDTRLRSSISFQNILHVFHMGRLMETDILDIKLSQKLASIDHDPLFLVFLDLHKSYDTVDRGHLLMTLEGYGAGPRVCGLME